MSTVLVVDDSELTHALVRRALEQRGFTTVHVGSSDEAIDLLGRGEHIDALVVDIVMPKIDGIQLVQILRSRPGIGSSTPVVFYSAHLDQTVARKRIPNMQPVSVVAKDGNIEDLVETVTNLIHAHAAAAGAPTPSEVIQHVGKGLVAIRVQTGDSSGYELRRGSEVLLEAPTIDKLMRDAQSKGLA